LKEIKFSKEQEATLEELDQIARRFKPKHEWSDFEVEILKRYYGKVPNSLLAEKTHHGEIAIRSMASKLGLAKGVELREK